MKKSEITLFAEDTNIICKLEDVKFNIKISITEAISWFNKKKLSAYSKKISIGVFS